MKTVMTGVFSAVVAGLLLFLAQNWWTQTQNGEKQRVSIDQNTSALLSKDELKYLASKASEYEKANIQFFTISNVGSEDIAEKSFSSANTNVWAYGIVDYPNRNPKSASLSYDNKSLTLTFHLLPAQSKGSFWVATSSLSGMQDFSADSAGVKVKSSLEKIEESNPFPWLWFAVPAALLVSLLLGVSLGGIYLESELKKRGIDTKALLKSPETQSDELAKKD